MALFTVNRYFGNEDSFSSKIPDDVKYQRLDKLLSYANTKKRKIEVSHDIDKDVEPAPGNDNFEKCATDVARTPRKKSKPNGEHKNIKSDLVNNTRDEKWSDASGSGSVTSTVLELHSSCSNFTKSGDVIDSSHDAVDDSHDPITEMQDSVDDPHDEAGNSIESSQDLEESDSQYFPVLGKKASHCKKPLVLRKLPLWMENPTLVEMDIKENSIPVSELAVTLPNLIQRNLQKMKIVKFFPVQYHVIPNILSTVHGPLLSEPSGKRPKDICVNAPTGSGKTLAYAIPIVTAIMNRVVCHIRALIVVPSRDLALQVRAVLMDVAKGTGITVVTITGQSSIEKEQTELTNMSSIPISSRADIVVATPGRLVDHMTLTRHFCLGHLRFLVIDEVDRLLDQSFQDWIAKLFDFISKGGEHQKPLSLYSCLTAGDTFPHAISDSKFDIFIPIPCSSLPFHSVTSTHCSVQKLLFSATIPQNPEKLALLKLHTPKLFTTAVIQECSNDQVSNYTGRFALPSTLKEYSIVCPAKYKPLAVIHVIENDNLNRVLCFTSSKDSTHRLCLLLKHYGISRVAEFSAGLPQKKRKFILSEFSSGNINMLVCSDAMSRGMDVDKVYE